MILRSFNQLPFLFFLSLSVLLNARADSFDCIQTIERSQYNFTTLGGFHEVNRTRLTPPSTTIDSLAFDFCGDLKPKEGTPEQDQCPTGTRACLTQINVKNSEPDRVISVIPLATTEKLAPDVTANLKSPQHLIITFHGPEYPPKSNETTSSVAQSIKLTLWCEPHLASNTTIESYDGSVLELTHFGVAGCPLDKNNLPDKDPAPEPAGGSGIGVFFLLLLFAFLAYFAIGGYYNYTTYGARGLDLIPHRDFWQEVPYMLSDIVSHLCSSAKPRRTTRNGYIQV